MKGMDDNFFVAYLASVQRQYLYFFSRGFEKRFKFNETAVQLKNIEDVIPGFIVRGKSVNAKSVNFSILAFFHTYSI